MKKESRSNKISSFELFKLKIHELMKEIESGVKVPNSSYAKLVDIAVKIKEEFIESELAQIDYLFEAFYQAYPIEDGHKRKLRGIKVAECKKLFAKIIRSGKYTSDDLIKAVSLEIKERNENEQINYMKSMYSWLKDEGYRPYLENESLGDKEEGKGEAGSFYDYIL